MSIQHTESCIVDGYDMFPKPVLISLLRTLETAYALHRAKWFMADVLTPHNGDIKLMIDAALKLTHEEIERFYRTAGENLPSYIFHPGEMRLFIEHYRRELCKWPSDADDEDIPIQDDPVFEHPFSLIPDSYYRTNAWYYLQRFEFLNDMRGSLAAVAYSEDYDDDDEEDDDEL